MYCCSFSRAAIASSNAAFTSSGGRAAWKLTSSSVMPMLYGRIVSSSTRWVSLRTIVRPSVRILSMVYLPITPRRALSVAWLRLSSALVTLNRYASGLVTRYCTFISTRTTFSSEVSITPEAASSRTDSTLTGRTSSMKVGFQFKPGCTR